ncbi:MAG: MFS transporter, partial [Gammaproteobacteria bacterium]|nr:MFS transporter [Gammaproteobacteria bacterium]
MTAQERQAALSLAAIFSFRMLGLFMILPVFSLYAAERFGTVAPVLIGLAIGAYGLANAVLQVPFGMLSDRFGCKPVIAVGLVIFALGSVIAASADSIGGIIFGRVVQGSGAIAAAVMALAADLTREEHRTKAMTMIGASIGLSFAASLAAGPILNHWIGVPGIFWLTALLALVGIALLYLVVPNPVSHRPRRDTGAVPGFFFQVLRDPQLLRLDGGIFALHCVLTASFVALPFALRDFAGVDTSHHGYVYLPVLLIALVVMVPLVVVAEKRRRLKEVFLSAVAGIALAEFGLAFFHHSLAAIVALLLLFFCAFNVLEALLPSLIAKFA